MFLLSSLPFAGGAIPKTLASSSLSSSEPGCASASVTSSSGLKISSVDLDVDGNGATSKEKARSYSITGESKITLLVDNTR